jgi:hypothetical protein
MVKPQLAPVYDDLIDFLIKKATPHEIIAFQASAEAKARAEYLLERNSAGKLSPEESSELQQMYQLDLFVSVLKVRALEALSKP